MTATSLKLSRAAFLSAMRGAALTLIALPTLARAATSATQEFLKQGFTGFKSKGRATRELMDREEIAELAACYAQRVARRISAADLFTDDGAFIVHLPNTPTQEARGRTQLDKTFAAIATKPDISLPAVHNHVISVSGDEAVGVCWLEIRVLGEQTEGSGYYEDRYRREKGRWKFVVRESTMVDWRQGAPLDPTIFAK